MFWGFALGYTRFPSTLLNKHLGLVSFPPAGGAGASAGGGGSGGGGVLGGGDGGEGGNGGGIAWCGRGRGHGSTLNDISRI